MRLIVKTTLHKRTSLKILQRITAIYQTTTDYCTEAINGNMPSAAETAAREEAEEGLRSRAEYALLKKREGNIVYFPKR
jgi:hypothetical protein